MGTPRNQGTGALSALLSVMLCVALGDSSVSAVPAHDKEPFYFAKGTRWIYDASHNGTRKSVTQEVLRVTTQDLVWRGEPATVFHLGVKTVNLDSGGIELELTTSYLALVDGYLATGSPGGLPVRIYKLHSKPGDSWPCVDPRVTGSSPLVFVHLGREDVTVPAGTFKNAHHIQVEISLEGSRHLGELFILPPFGILKSRTLSERGGERIEGTMELRKFIPALEY